MSIAYRWYEGIELTPAQAAANRAENAQRRADIQQADAIKRRRLNEAFNDVATDAITEHAEIDAEGWACCGLQHMPESAQRAVFAAWLNLKDPGEMQEIIISAIAKSDQFPFNRIHTAPAQELGEAIKTAVFDWAIPTIQESDEWEQAERDACTMANAPPEEPEDAGLTRNQFAYLRN